MHPHPDAIFLDRSHQHVFGAMADLVDQVVNYSTHLFNHLLEGDVPEHKITAALLLRHLFEQLDGVAGLVREGRTEPAKVVLRAGFEASLNLSYLTEGEIERRALHYRLANLHRRLRMIEMFDPETAAGRQAQVTVNSDVTGFRVAQFETTAVAKALRAMMQLPYLDEARADWEARLAKVKGKKKDSRMPKWYSLGGGPRNLEALAVHLGRGGQYHVLYRDWSAIAHGESLLEKTKPSKDGGGEILAIRDPTDLQMVSFLATSTALLNLSEVVDRLAPEQRKLFSAFFEEIKPEYHRVGDQSTPIIQGVG